MGGFPALVGAGVAAIAAAFLTWAWILVATRWGMQDEPGFRRLHATRTPRGGGAALLLAWLAGLAVAFAGTAAAPGPLAWIAFGAGLMAACGLLDDLASLPPPAKLLLQLLAAAAIFLPLAALRPPFELPAALVLGFGLVYFVNCWNFMDGSNGMIAGQSLLVALAVGLWPGQEPVLRAAAFALAAACAGFLPFNFPKARVFLGDAGSFGLGAALYLLLLCSCRNGAMAPWQALLLCTPMLLDSAFTLGRRILGGRRFWRAHREHLYQYAVRKGHSHARVALAYAAATAAAWGLALAGQGNPSTAVQVGLVLLAWLAGAAAYFGLRRRWLARPLRTGSHG